MHISGKPHISRRPDAGLLPAELRDFFEAHRQIALAFSGGCDSAFLLYAAVTCGVDIGVYYVHSQFQPAFELEDARRLADELGCKLRLIEADVLADADVRSNPRWRCYFCKKRIFGEILRAAHADGYDCVMDGTNASDDAGDRPGMRALGEMQVLSPLRMCGVTKAQVRGLSREAGLFTWNKPAYACLATRIPTGREIDAESLARVERAETALAEMGFSDFRVRLDGAGNAARLEVTEAQMPLLLERRGEILAALEADFDGVYLNLKPRKGMEI